jgi:hypothetical protein
MGVIAARFVLQFLPTGVMDVTTATRSRGNPMSENAIDSENTSKSAPAAQPEGKRQPSKKSKPAKKAWGREGGQQIEDRSHKQESRGHRHNEACQGRTLAEIMKTTGWQVQRRPHSAKRHVGFEEPVGSATLFLRTIQ